MKVFAISASVLVLLTGVALSQDGENANTIAEKLDVAAFRAKQEQKKQQELDAAYKAALKEKKVPSLTLGAQCDLLIIPTQSPNNRVDG
jgi:hypothetical protein